MVDPLSYFSFQPVLKFGHRSIQDCLNQIGAETPISSKIYFIYELYYRYNSTYHARPLLNQLWGTTYALGVGVGEELFTCPYPLKVQACPPRDQRPALQSRVSGQEEKG